ncbi:ATP synthase subunit I [Desulfohalobium retbaense]|uniref:ATP synthase I n=1 Tax=Desulfohalobium retbaense (strain ATCC 49708 / DSM 5692 / JCM 16813 / HR100) TaxID=485915 RepID=C8X498_DESRD|nr:ATP synthase subunit I [Desulfohalobium retbaense]ACV69372.1 ATP synthase I [Desulfohalobium retbaense DSM 5692]
MTTKINRRIEGWLFRRGFAEPEVRELVRNQLYVAGLMSVVLLLVAQGERWAIDFAIGAGLITANFYFLARFIAELVRMQKGAVTALLSGFYIRLGALAGILFVLIVFAQASIPALLAGLSTAVVNILLWGAGKMVGRVR